MDALSHQYRIPRVMNQRAACGNAMPGYREGNAIYTPAILYGLNPETDFMLLTLVSRLGHVVESQWFERTITVLIVLNAITLGLETIPGLEPEQLNTLIWLDRIFLSIFCVELGARMLVFRQRFFHDPWRIFDLIIVSIALLPATGAFSVLRALRVLRVYV